MLFPIGLDDMKVGRIPVLSAGIAILCVLSLPLAMVSDGASLSVLGLVPERGAVQIGWLTSGFIHAGILHLLFNLLFFYLSGPVVEDAWGKGRFLLLYFGGGLVADLGQYALDPGSAIPIVGASGAIAACMGAMCVQFPHRKVRMFYWVWFYVGTFFVPVWLFGGLWFGREVFDLAVFGTSSGVAFGAHLAGFAFGAGLAFTIRKLQGDPFAERYAPPKGMAEPVALRPAQESVPVPTPPSVSPQAPTPPSEPLKAPTVAPTPAPTYRGRAFPKRPT